MPTVTLRDTGVTAAQLESTNPTTNFQNRVEVGENNTASGEVDRTVIKFPLDTPTNIPAGSRIVSATLQLTVNSDRSSNTRTMRVYRVKRAWVDSQATWNQYSSGNNWGSAGCGDSTNDREATDIGSASVSDSLAVDTTVSISLTPASVQQMLSGGSFTNNGFLLQVDTETDDKYVYYSVGEASVAKRPTLTVEYIPAGGAFLFNMV